MLVRTCLHSNFIDHLKNVFTVFLLHFLSQSALSTDESESQYQ